MYQSNKIETEEVIVRHRITLSRTKTKLVNKVHSILDDKYDYRTELTKIYLANQE